VKTIHTFQKQYLSNAVPDFPYQIFVRVRVVSSPHGFYCIEKEMKSYNIKKKMSSRWNEFGSDVGNVFSDKRIAKNVAHKLLNRIYKDSLAAYQKGQAK
jgi:hypothetical protein